MQRLDEFHGIEDDGNLSAYAISRILCMKGFLLQLVTAQSAQNPQHIYISLSPSQIATTCSNNCMYFICMYIIYLVVICNHIITLFQFDTTAC